MHGGYYGGRYGGVAPLHAVQLQSWALTCLDRTGASEWILVLSEAEQEMQTIICHWTMGRNSAEDGKHLAW